jgi:hypothetical protein
MWSLLRVFLRLSVSRVEAISNTWRRKKILLWIYVLGLVLLDTVRLEEGQSCQLQQGGGQPNYLEDKEKQ